MIFNRQDAKSNAEFAKNFLSALCENSASLRFN